MSLSQPLTRSRQFAGGGSEILPALAAEETQVQMSVNGEVWLSFHCSPNDLEALAVGFLYNEGFVQSADEVASLHICDARDHIDVWLTHLASKPEQWSRASGCQGGLVQPTAQMETAKPGRSYLPVTGAALFARADAFMTALTTREHLRQGLHTSMLLEGDEERLVSSDIGRHNTLDKIAGARLLTPFEMREPTLITTGRISVEMVTKAARMEIPLVMSLHSASDMAIAAADRMEITLVGHARRSQVDIYTHPEKIVFEKR